jgi:hypothetical protein
MYMDIEVVSGRNEKVYRSWDGFYLESSAVKPGVHEVTNFGNKLMIKGIPFLLPLEVRKFYAEAEPHIKIIGINFM